MNQLLRILNVEDSERDAALLTHHLKKAGYDLIWERVQTSGDLKTALAAEHWDLILCDYSMPGFNALDALAVLREFDLDIPFIIISGTAGEEIAVEALLAGANDYIPKGNLTRLVPAIERELKQAEDRRKKREADLDLRNSDQLYRTLFDYAPDGIIIACPQSYYLDANASMCSMLGYSHSELIGRHASDIVIPAEIKNIQPTLDSLTIDTDHNRVWQFRRKDGSVFPGDVLVTQMPDGNLMAMIRDISGQEQHRREKDGLNDQIERERSRLKNIVASVPGVVWEASGGPDASDQKISFVSDYVESLLGYTPDEWTATPDFWLSIVHPDDREFAASASLEAYRGKSLQTARQFRWRTKNGNYIWVEANSVVVLDGKGDPVGVRGVTVDITERKRTEDERRIIADIMQAAISTPHLDEFLRLVHRAIGELLPAENCFIMLRDAETGRVDFEFWVDKYDPRPSPRVAGRGFSDYVLRKGKPLLRTRSTMKAIIDSGEADQVGSFSPSWAGVPLHTPEGTIGVLVLQHYESENAYTERDLEFLTSIGDQVALAIARKKADVQLKEAEHKYRSLFENATEGIFQNTPDGKMISANPALARIMGYGSPAEMIRERGELTDQIYVDPVRRAEFTDRLAENGSVSGFEYEARRKNGSRIWVSENTRVVRDAEGNVLYYEGSLQDITERKKAKEDLLKSEERYRELVENAIDIIYTHDLEGNYTSINKAAERITGYTNHEARKMNMMQIVAPGSIPKARAMIESKLGGEKRSSYEVQILAKDGQPVQLDVNSRIIYEDGIAIGVQGIARDITERKIAELAVRESEERYRDVVENANDIIYTHDLEGNYTSVNAAAERITGYTRAEAMRMKMADIVVPDDLERGMATAKAIASGASVPVTELRLSAKDGRIVTVEINSRAILENGVPVGVHGIARDISDRKRANAELQEKTALLEAQLNSSIDGILVVDGEGRQIIQNQQLIDLLGIPQHIANDENDEVQVKWFTGMMKDPEKFFEKVVHLYSHPDEISRDEIELKNGTILDRYSAPVRGKDNKNYGRIWTFRDITESKRADDTLRESETRLRTIIDTEPECVKLLGPDGSLLEMNAAGLRMIEADSFSDVANHNVTGLIVEEDRQAFSQLIDRVFRGESGVLDFRITGLKGTRRWLDTHASPLRDANGKITALVGITRDITARKRAEMERKIIFEIIQGAITSHDLNGFLELVKRSVSGLVYAENFTVMLHDEATEQFKYEFWADKFDPAAASRPVSEGFGGYVLRTGQPLLLTETLKNEMIDRGDAVLRGKPSLSWIGIPLRTPTQTIGVMVLQHYEVENAYDQGDLEFLSSVGDQIALAIERQRAQDAVRESNEKFHQLADNISDVFWVRSPDMQQIYYISPAFEKIWGHSLESVLADSDQWRNFIVPEDRKYVSGAYERLMGSSPTIDVEYRIVRSDGEIRWVRTRGFQVMDPQGNVIRLAGIVSDITERMHVIESLAASEERYRELVENAIDVIFTLDLQGNYTSVNRASEDVTGFTVQETLSRNILQSIVPEHRKSAKQLLEAQLKGGDLSAFELEIIGKDGRRVALEIKTRQIIENGIPVGVQGIARDITERKRSDAALAASEANFESLFDAANDAIMVLKDGVFIDCNRRTETMFGCTKEWIIGRSPMELSPAIQPDGRTSSEKASLYIAPALKGIPQFFEWQHSRRDGTLFDTEVSLNKVEFHDKTHVQAIVRDITGRKLLDSALAASELRYHSLFENMIEGYAYCETIFEGDRLMDFVYLEVNGAFAKLTGLENVVGRKISEIIPNIREQTPELFDIYGRVALTGTPEKVETYVEALGVWLSITVYSSSPEQFVAVFDNITHRRLAERSLIDSQEQLALAAESVNLGIWDWDIVENHLRWDDRMYELYGIRKQDFEGAYDSWQKGLHPDDRKASDENIRAALANERPFNNEFRVVWPNGEIRNIEARALVRFDADGSPLRMIGVNWDITGRMALEDQYRQSQKMEAVGVLAGGIAHDFNNLLTVINGYSDLTLRKIPAADPLRHHIKEIKVAGDRAAELTSQLLAFSRKQVMKPKVYNLNVAIRDFDKMLRRLLRENIELRTVLAPDLGNIKADPGQIEQVIMNLAVNARDSMPNGGTLTIETQNIFLDEGYVSQRLAISSGQFIRLIVTDTGEGISGETQNHIFEPFYTTKEVGKGTGLGLSTVHGIVKQSGGDIMVYSEVGRGTTFKIYLPSVDLAVEKVKWVGDAVEKYLGSETILLVEDEEIVRNLVREVLTDSGYKVLEAANGKAALSICETYTDPIHMLLTDVVMPKMSGNELRDIVVQQHPHIRVLFMSGYTDDSIAHSGILDSDVEFIEKPFTPDSISRKVREVFEY